jgi:hypothetical protein
VYAWRRFWVREGSDLLLEDDAYLPDPEEEYGSFFNSEVLSLEQISGEACKILLGEAGMGKSRSLRIEFDELRNRCSGDDTGALIDIGAVTSMTDLQGLLAKDTEVCRWAEGLGMLHLYFDSLDEALPRYPALPKALASVVQGLPKEQLRLTIACRAGEMPQYLINELKSHFGDECVSIWHIAPLRKKDIRIAAAENRLDADDFLRSIAKLEVQALAASPITLDLLLGGVTSGSALISDVWSLYERGCRKLLSEDSESSRSTLQERMDLDQKMAVAGRIACVTIFGAYSAVDINTDASTQDGIVAATEIRGGQEVANENAFAVGQLDIEDVLKSGVFTASGCQFKWSHKSYGEFLAARHLRSNAVPTNQILSLIGFGGRVAPALRGVTTWLTSRIEPIFREIVKIDPEVLLFSDLSVATDQQKAEIVNWLLKQAASNNPIIHEWGVSWTFRKLQHADLGRQLNTVIDGSAPVSARYCAIEVANACGGAGLQPLLADLALNESQPIMLRIAAASCVADHGDSVVKARLLALAIQSPSNEEDERLQVQALSAVWPQHCTWIDVKDGLGSRDSSTTTARGRFLAHDFAKGVRSLDLAEVLRWLAQRDWPPNPLSGWAAATDLLLTRGATAPWDPVVGSGIADVLFVRLSKHFMMFADRGKGLAQDTGPWPAAARRGITAELIPRLVAGGHAVDIGLHGSRPLLTEDDVEFVFDRWMVSAGNERLAWQRVLEVLVTQGDNQVSEKMLERMHTFPELRQALSDCRERLQLPREIVKLEQQVEDEKCRKAREERVVQIHESLNQASNDSKRFPRLLDIMSFPLDTDCAAGVLQVKICEMPGWAVLEVEEHARLIEIGKRFLDRESPSLLWGLFRGGSTHSSAAGYRVLCELVILDPEYLRAMSTATWERWAPAIVVCQCDLSEKEYGDKDAQLLRFASAKANDVLVRTLGIAVRRGRAPFVEREVIRFANLIYSKEFEARLFASLPHPKVRDDVYFSAMAMLLGRAHPEAQRAVKASIERVSDATPEQLPRLAVNVALWLEQDVESAWPETWKGMRRFPEFARVLLGVRLAGGMFVERVVKRLSDDQLKGLYIWLRATFGNGLGILPPTNAPELSSQGAVIFALQERHQASSVAALKQIEVMYPADWHLRQAAWRAERALVEISWEAISPSEVKRIIADNRQLLVRDEQELMEAVSQSLLDYQDAIRAEGSRVMRLWNEASFGHTPKPEESLSREISAELQGLLGARGVKATLETKIREGQFVDIYVSAVTADSKHRELSLIIEVKGCWNPELKTALKTQLEQRYLKGNQSPLGIYLVVWFLCDKWDESDSRKKRTRFKSLSRLLKYLEAQASTVSGNGRVRIRPFVLDATIEGVGAKDSPKRESASSKRRR